MNSIVQYLTVFVLCLVNLSSAAPSSTQPTSCPIPTAFQLRFPPTIRNNTPAEWTPPPYAWIFGNWWVTYSSRLTYQSLYNFQADTYPAFPTANASASQRRNIDLTSWNSAITGNTTADEHIYTVFGYDTPATDVASAVYQFNGTGPLSGVGNYWEIMAWGYDRNGDAYRAEYETVASDRPDEPCINIVSRSETGPDNTTLAEIVTAMHGLFDGSEIGVYVANLTAIPNDGRRSNLGPVACDASCMDNENLPMSQ